MFSGVRVSRPLAVPRLAHCCACSFNTTTAASSLRPARSAAPPPPLHRPTFASAAPLPRRPLRAFFSANSLSGAQSAPQTFPDAVSASPAPEATVPYGVPAPPADSDANPIRAEMVKPIQGTQYALDAQFKKISRDFRTYVRVKSGTVRAFTCSDRISARSRDAVGLTMRTATSFAGTPSRCRPTRCLT